MWRFATVWCVATILAGGAAVQAQSLDAKVKALNDVTGSETALTTLKAILDDKANVKSLIAAAVPLAKDPEKLRYNASLVLALAAADLKDISAADAFYRNCIHQGAKLQSPVKMFQSFSGLMDLLYENKKYDESVKLCQEILALKTDDDKERVVLFAATDRNGETQFQDDDSFRTVERLAPLVYRQMAQGLAKLGKHDEAHRVLDNLVRQTNDWRVIQMKAMLFRDAGDLDKAVQTYEEVIDKLRRDRRIKPEDRNFAIDRNQYLLSNVYVELKQVDKAVELLEGLVKANPDDPGYNNDLGYILADNDRRLDEAEKMIRHALDKDRERRKKNPELYESNRENGAYLDSLGWVLYKKKNLAEAKKVLQQATEDKEAQHIEIYDHLGDVLIELNERPAALEAWRKGLEHVTESRRDQDRKRQVEEKLKKHGQ